MTVKDYNVQVKVRNNHLLNAMKTRGITTAAELSRFSGASQHNIGKFINLTQGAYLKDGSYNPDIVKVSIALNRMITDLFPEQHLDNPLETNMSEIDLDVGEMMALTNHNVVHIGQEDPHDHLSTTLSDVVSNLTTREAKVINLMYGLEGNDPLTLEQVGELFDLSKTRIAQIEAKALRKMRHPSRSIELREHTIVGKSKPSFEDNVTKYGLNINKVPNNKAIDMYETEVPLLSDVERLSEQGKTLIIKLKPVEGYSPYLASLFQHFTSTMVAEGWTQQTPHLYYGSMPIRVFKIKHNNQKYTARLMVEILPASYKWLCIPHLHVDKY